MIESMKYSKVNDAERRRILQYHKSGFNPTQIASLLYTEFGRARRSSTVRKVISDAEL